MSIKFINLSKEDNADFISSEKARRSENEVYSILTPIGKKSIDSPYDPTGEAEQTIGQISREMKNVILLGSGSGYFPFELVKTGIKKALIIGCSSELIKKSVSKLEENSSESIEYKLVSGEDPKEVWEQVVLHWMSSVENFEIVIHPRETKAYPGFFSALLLRIEKYRNRTKSLKTNKINRKKLLFFGNDGLLERELKGEFKRLGWQIDFKPSISDKRLTSDETFNIISSSKPDLVLSTNNHGSDIDGSVPELCEIEGIPWVTWLLDDPQYLIGPERRIGAGKKRYGACWDINGIKSWEKVGYSNSFLLPLATDKTLFKPGNGDPSLSGRIVFVGSPRFASTSGFFHRLDLSENASIISDYLEEQIISTRKSPNKGTITNIIKELKIEEEFEDEAIYRLGAFAVQQANLKYRCNVLNTLSEFSPVVYGSGWEGLLDERIELRSPVDYYTELPKIYQSDSDFVSMTNLQMRSSPNQRVFEIGACSRVVLTDHLDGLFDLFGPLSGKIAYKSIDELRKKIDLLIESKSEREMLANALFDNVINNHTISHRVKKILTEMGE